MKIFIASMFLSVLTFAASAQTKVVPIIDLRIGGLLGGVENGKYLDAKTTIGKLLAEQNYTPFLPDGKSEKFKLKKPIDSADGCDFFLNIEPGEYETIFKKGGVALGEGFGWTPQPRTSKAVDLESAEYLKIMNDFLRTKRIMQPLSKFSQAFEIDLDGDGQEEIILAASGIVSYEERKPRTAYDEYSLVLIRKIISGKPQNIVVIGEFYPKTRDYYDGNDFMISSILDLNGDGKMELVIYGQYYEGGATQVFEITGRKASEIKILSIDCGI